MNIIYKNDFIKAIGNALRLRVLNSALGVNLSNDKFDARVT